MNPEYEVGLSVRRDNASQKDGGLLIKHDTKQPSVRRYDPTRKTLAVVPTEMWDKSSAPVARCGEQFPPEMTLLRLESKTKQLIGERGEITPTKGKTVLNLTASSQKNRVADLSASGTAGGDYSVIPFSSGSGASGQYSMQIYSLKTRQLENYLFEIPTKETFTSFTACWSADEKFVVYSEVGYRFLVVVEVVEAD